MKVSKVPNQSKFVKVPAFEEAFYKRYGKNVEVYRAVTMNESGKLDSVSIHLYTKQEKKKYVLTEVLDEKQKTKYALSGKDKPKHKYKSYLEAEIYVADLIGEEEHGNSK